MMFQKKISGFNSDYNKVSIIDKKVMLNLFPKIKKVLLLALLARIILDKLLMNDKNIN